MHTLYHTDAYVLKSFPNGDSGKAFYLLTKEFGLVIATAQGIRLDKSKLKYSLQDFSKSHVTLVKGKGGWRITTAQPNFNTYLDRPNEENFEIIARAFSLLSRLLQGEESNIELYEIIDNGVNYLLKNTSVDPKDVECVLVLRILNNLGYIGDNKDLTFFTIDNDWSNEYISEIKNERQNALNEINRAIRESQL